MAIESLTVAIISVIAGLLILAFPNLLRLLIGGYLLIAGSIVIVTTLL